MYATLTNTLRRLQKATKEPNMQKTEQVYNIKASFPYFVDFANTSAGLIPFYIVKAFQKSAIFQEITSKLF